MNQTLDLTDALEQIKAGAKIECWDAKNLASARIHTWPPDA